MKHLLTQLQSLEFESQIKGNLEKKVQKMLDERLSMSKDSLNPESEIKEHLFSPHQQQVLFSYKIQELEQKLQAQVKENQMMRAQLQ